MQGAGKTTRTGMNKQIFTIVCALGLVLLLKGPASAQNKNDDLLTYSDRGRKAAITSRSQLEVRRQQILDSMQSAMGKLPALKGNPPFQVSYRDTVNENAYTRYTITFTVAPGEKIAAYLYFPRKKPGETRFPAMVALHGTDVLGKMAVDGQGSRKEPWIRKNLGYGKELAERGYVVIAPDYPGFGDAKGHDFAADRYASGSMKAIFNQMRCIDLLQTLDTVDPGRIGIIGHSLGGHNAMFTGAFDDRLQVVVSSCGWTLMDYYDVGEKAIHRYGARLGPWSQELYMPLLREKYKLKPERFPFDFDEVMVAIAPRAFFSCSPLRDANFDYHGVEKGIANVMPLYRMLKAEDKLRVQYPDDVHDFPYETRQEAYRFIDSILKKP